MSRPCRARVLAVTAVLLAAGCQSYNFNPVGHCVLQPGSERVTLSTVSTADVLFVVDDSGSMEAEQRRLADAFDQFVEYLSSTNRQRASMRLLPLDFHVAVTTTSVYFNQPTGSNLTCSSDWTGSGGKLACVLGGTPVRAPKACTQTSQCTDLSGAAIAGVACRKTCAGFKGEGYCCSDGGAGLADTFPLDALTALVTCDRAGTACGKLNSHYAFADTGVACSAGNAVDEYPFPQGEFVGSAAGSSANPRVLHFDKELFPAFDPCLTSTACGSGEQCVANACRRTCAGAADCPATRDAVSGRDVHYACKAGTCEPLNRQGFAGDSLKTWFKQNVKVGTCGSNEEQPLEAARLALRSAVAGTQTDTWTFDPSASGSALPTWTQNLGAGLRVAGSKAGWPNKNSKLVLVFVGDEDDCSSPQDPSAGVIMSGGAGNDACTKDPTTDAPDGHKLWDVQTFVDYFTGLGRPIAAGFIFSTAQSVCDASSCTPGICCDAQCIYDTYPAMCAATPAACTCSYGVCGGQAKGSRLFQLAQALQAKKKDVVMGSICDPNFGTILEEIAKIAKPPTGLELPTLPAEAQVTVLRIASTAGETRKICGAPLDPDTVVTGWTVADAQATKADWWFTASSDPGLPVHVSQFVYINPYGSCIANPGETYSADYLGVVPAGGCDPTLVDALTGGSVDCQLKLGGTTADWECYVPIAGQTTGTCTCRK